MGKSLKRTRACASSPTATATSSTARSTGHAARRAAPRSATPTSVVAMDDKPSQALRARQGTSMWNALEAVQGRRVAGGDLRRQHRRADGARHARAAQGAGRQPAGDRRALPSLNPRGYNVLLDAGADIRADADDLLKYRGDGRRLRPQRARPEAPARRPAQRRHRGAQGPRRAARGGRRASPRVAPAGDFEYIGYVEGNDMPPAGRCRSSPTASPATSR